MIHVVSAKRLLCLKDRSRFSWLYLGSYQGSVVVLRALLEAKRIYIGRMIEKITDALRDDFIDHVGTIAELQRDKVLWYSSRLASKSISQTPIFSYYVYLKLLETLSSRQDEDVLVVTDDDDLLEIIRQAACKNICLVDPPCFFIDRIIGLLKGHLKVVWYLIFWLIGRWFSQEPVETYDVIIHSWIDRRTFSDPSKFIDPYLGDLGAWLKEQGFVVGRMVPLRIPLRFMWALRKRFKAIFYPLWAVSFSDLWKAFTSRMVVEVPQNIGRDGHLLRVLLLNEIAWENRTKNYIGNFLLYFGYRRLFGQLKDSATVIYPFENQPCEKMLILASPKTIHKIGYAHAAIPYNWLDYRVSALEHSAPCPDAILTAGQKWADFLRPYYRNIPVEVAGAIRYTYLFGRKNEKVVPRARQVVVVALPIDPFIALFLQARVLASVRDGTLDSFFVKIKSHPFLPADALLVKQFSGYTNCSFVEDAVCELLTECDLLITSSSTVAFESLALDVKTLVYIPESVTWGMEHSIKEDVFLAYEDNFSEKVLEAIKSTKVPDWDVSEYFSQPDFSIFLNYFTKK